MQENNFNNIQEFENVYELRKALTKLENEYQKKDHELNLISDLCKDLKALNEKERKEKDNLNIKLNTVRVDMRNMEKNYQSEIELMKMKYSKEIEIYNNKILKLSEYNPTNLQKNIEYKIENKYKQNLSLKDKEIEDLSNKLSQLEKKYELLLSEYDEFKLQTQNEFDMQKTFHQNEINSLLEKMRLSEDINSKRNNSDGENTENFIQMKKELENARNQVNELNNEIDQLRHDKELLIIEKNEHKINLIKERDSRNFNNKNLEINLNKANNTIENMNREIDMLKIALKERDFKIDDLMKQNQNLNEKLANRDIEQVETKNMITNIKNIMMNSQEEHHKKMLEDEKLRKESLFKQNMEKENMQKQIDELTIKLKDAKSNKPDVKLEGTNKGYKDLKVKLKLMTEKKNEYKLKCKLANENLKEIINKLDKNQEEEFLKIIENNKKKYLQNKKMESEDEE